MIAQLMRSIAHVIAVILIYDSSSLHEVCKKMQTTYQTQFSTDIDANDMHSMQNTIAVILRT